ncbi:MAG TPA: hypothetical protein VH575_04925 [Gemmataceae bacterium]
MALGLISAVFAFVPLCLLASCLGIHSLGFAWPVAVVIGVGSLHGSSRQGSPALGNCALVLTAGTLLAAFLLAPGFWPVVREQLSLALSLGACWWSLALASAYRIGSQRL